MSRRPTLIGSLGRVVGAVAALVLPSVACAADGSGDAEATSTEVPATTAAPASPVTTAPRPGMSANEIAVRNVLDMEAAEFSAALDPPDPNRPGLLDLNTGAARDKRIEVITGLRDRGEYSRRAGGGPVPHKTDSVRFADSNTAIGHECYVDDRVTRKIDSGEVVDPVVTSLRLETTVLREPDGAWRIASRKLVESYPTRNACPHVG